MICNVSYNDLSWFVCFFVLVSVSLPLSVRPLVRPFVCLCLSVCVSVCRSVSLPLSLFMSFFLSFYLPNFWLLTLLVSDSFDFWPFCLLTLVTSDSLDFWLWLFGLLTLALCTSDPLEFWFLGQTRLSVQHVASLPDTSFDDCFLFEILLQVMLHIVSFSLCLGPGIRCCAATGWFQESCSRLGSYCWTWRASLRSSILKCEWQRV